MGVETYMRQRGDEMPHGWVVVNGESGLGMVMHARQPFVSLKVLVCRCREVTEERATLR